MDRALAVHQRHAGHRGVVLVARDRLELHGGFLVTQSVDSPERDKLYDQWVTIGQQHFRNVGFWFEMPAGWAAAFTARERHFMGGIHAVEHAMIGLFPLLAIADRCPVHRTLHSEVKVRTTLAYN